MDEDALRFYRGAFFVGDEAGGERFRAVDALDVSLCAQRPSELGLAQITQDQGAGVGGSMRLVRRRAQHVVEDQRAHAAVDVAGRAFVGCAENEFGPHLPVGFAVYHQRRRDRVAQADHGVAPGDGAAVGRALHAERSRLRGSAQFICGTVDFELRRCDRRGVGCGADADVDESAD